MNMTWRFVSIFFSFFVIRDGFLLYYPESERREYEKNQSVNFHPKVVF